MSPKTQTIQGITTSLIPSFFFFFFVPSFANVILKKRKEKENKILSDKFLRKMKFHSL